MGIKCTYIQFEVAFIHFAWVVFIFILSIDYNIASMTLLSEILGRLVHRRSCNQDEYHVYQPT